MHFHVPSKKTTSYMNRERHWRFCFISVIVGFWNCIVNLIYNSICVYFRGWICERFAKESPKTKPSSRRGNRGQHRSWTFSENFRKILFDRQKCVDRKSSKRDPSDDRRRHVLRLQTRTRNSEPAHHFRSRRTVTEDPQQGVDQRRPHFSVSRYFDRHGPELFFDVLVEANRGRDVLQQVERASLAHERAAGVSLRQRTCSGTCISRSLFEKVIYKKKTG